MAKKIHVRPGKGQSKFGFVAGIIFCLIGLFAVVPTFGVFGILWTAVAGYITFVHYRNGFTDKKIDSHVIEIDEMGEDITVVSKPNQEDVEERLRKLTNLYTQSLITREEYEQKKKDILEDL